MCVTTHRHDELHLDINIFPLMKQTRDFSLRKLLVSLFPASARDIVEIFLVHRPSRGPRCIEKTIEGSSRSSSTNREDRVVSRTRRIALRRAASHSSHRRAQNRFMPIERSFHRGSHKDAFTERYAKASPISHEPRSEPR